MSTSPLSSPSSAPGSKGPADPRAPATANLTPGKIWLNGDVLGCACPACAGPMSIRAWLMVGDCAVCGASIELTLEQEREVRRLLADRGLPLAAAKAAPVVKSAPKPPAPRRAPTAPTPPPLPPAPPPAPKVSLLTTVRRAGLLAGEVLNFLPAWLASLVVHLMLFILLGLWTAAPSAGPRNLVLSIAIGGQHLPGEPGAPDQFDLDDLAPLETGPVDPWDERRAAREAAQLQTAPDVAVPNQLPLKAVRQSLASPQAARMFEGRDPRVRAELLAREGGTNFTEAAVARGLRWIAHHQSSDGAWRLDRFSDSPECHGQCGGRGQHADVAGTALALLPMLGAGQTHQQGRYRPVVQKGIDWLVEHQRADGDFRGPGHDNMYAQGLATIALCEAYALSRDSALSGPAQRAINFVAQAQHSAGGWRYSPGEPGDTSVVGWQLMALRSGKLAGLAVSDRPFDQAVRFMDRVQSDASGSFYSYQPGSGATPTMTAEALLCRQYLGWPATNGSLVHGAEWLVDLHPPRVDQPNIYYWYYATQVMHHLGGPKWQKWNSAMTQTLLLMQETQGHEAGSWTPAGGAIGQHDTSVGGRLYMTSLAVCTLEVYYRHLPLYRAIELGR